MNILFICDEYPPGLNGGIGSIVQNLAREMVVQGHQVYVVGLYTYEYGCADFEEDMGVKIWRLRYGFKLPNIKKLYGVQRRIPNRLKRLLFAKRDFERYILFVKKIIAAYNIDIIEQPDWLSYAYFIGLENPTLPNLGLPVILKFHGSHSYSSFELNVVPNKHFVNIDKLNIQRANALASVSRHNALINKELFEINVPIKILYNGVTLSNELTNKKRKTKTVFYAGTVKQTKGSFSLMRAWNLVQQKMPDTELIVYGKGELKKAMEFINPAFRKTVHFEGHQSREKLFDALETATMAVFPSYTEAFSMAPLEAMSRACPTIYTKRSSGREVIKDGDNGLLIEPDNIEEIAEKIMLLMDQPALATRIGDAGRVEVLERFEISKITREHLEYYKMVAADFENKK